MIGRVLDGARGSAVGLNLVLVAAGGVERRAVVQDQLPAQPARGHRAARGAGGRAREGDVLAHAPAGARGRRLDGRRRWASRSDRQRVGVGKAAGVGNPQPDRVRAAGGVGEVGLGGRGVIEGAVTVKVPGVAERVVLRVGGPGAVKADGERSGAAGGVGGGVRGGRAVAHQRADAVDRTAAQIGVVEIAVRTDLEVHRPRGALDERLAGRGVRNPAGAREHDPDAISRVVGEEQRAVVLAREGAAVVELHARGRRAAGGAGLGRDLGCVVVGVQRGRHRPRAGGVEVLADVQVEVVVRGHPRGALVAGPAEVLHRCGRVGKAVDLLPGTPPDVAQVEVVGARAEGEAERVAQAGADDAADVRVRAAGVRVVGQRRARVRVNPDDRPVEARRVGAGACVLAAERAALGGRRRQGGAHPTRRIPAGVDRAAVLAVVGEVEARPVAGAGVERAVGAELEAAHRVARVLLAPVLDQHLFAAARQLREAAADHAAVTGRPRRARALVAPARGCAADRGIVGVEHVDKRAAAGERRVEGHAKQAPVPEVVHLAAQVGVDGRAGIVDVVEDFDQARLLRHEDPAVGREADDRRVGQAGPLNGLLETAGRQGGGLGQVDLGEAGLRAQRPSCLGLGGRGQQGGSEADD